MATLQTVPLASTSTNVTVLMVAVSTLPVPTTMVALLAHAMPVTPLPTPNTNVLEQLTVLLVMSILNAKIN
jgi:hypothetical protein